MRIVICCILHNYCVMCCRCIAFYVEYYMVWRVLHVVLCTGIAYCVLHVVLCTGIAYCVLHAVFMQCFSTEGRGPQGIHRELLWGPLVPQLSPSYPHPATPSPLSPRSSLWAPVSLITSVIRLVYSVYHRHRDIRNSIAPTFRVRYGRREGRKKERRNGEKGRWGRRKWGK